MSILNKLKRAFGMGTDIVDPFKGYIVVAYHGKPGVLTTASDGQKYMVMNKGGTLRRVA